MIRRRLFTLAAAVSFLLCAATVVMWVRSYRWCDRIDYGSRLGTYSRELTIKARSGWLVLDRYAASGMEIDVPNSWRYERNTLEKAGWPWPNASGPAPDELWFFGFRVTYSPANPPGLRTSLTMVAIPFWFICAALFVLPLIRMYRRIIGWRRSVGTCRTCGYDLTGNTSGVCPECGTEVAGKAGA